MIAAGAAAVLAAASLAIGEGVLSGAGGNMLTADGLGPRTLPGDVRASPAAILIVTGVGHFVLVCSVLAAAAGVGTIAKGKRDLSRGNLAAVSLLALTAVVTFAPHAVAYAAVFDRYALLPSILLVLALSRVMDLDSISATSLRLCMGLVLAGFVLSLLLAADHFRWQDARYSLIDRLLSAGVAAEDIDGGFEYNNLTAVLANREEAVSMSRVDPTDRPLRLTRHPDPGDEILATEGYMRLLGFRGGTVYAVRPPDESAR